MLRMHKILFSPDPAGGAHDAPLELGRGYPIPILHPLDACGASFLAPTANHLELGGNLLQGLGRIDAPGDVPRCIK